MNLFDRVMAPTRQKTLYSRIVGESEDGEYREHPLDLPEKMALHAVTSGADLSRHAEIKPLHNFVASKPTFKRLQKEGFVKHAAVFQSGVKTRERQKNIERQAAQDALSKKERKRRKGSGQRQEQGGYQGRSVSIHYWEHPVTGERRHAKFTNESPGQPADRF
jgi:hypothetical protein